MNNFIEKTFLKACRPRSRMTGSQWADMYRVIPPGTSSEPGEWRTSRTPYLREPMDAATDKRTETIVLEFSSQTGKSEALLNIIGYYADQEPAPILMLQPTVEMAEAFSKERIDPMFKASPGLFGKLEEGKDGRGTSRKSGDTIRMKQFTGGYLALVGANSPAGLASRPIRVLLCDEIDRYGTTKEGDPLKLAIQRTTNFHNRKIILVSTPTIKGASKIDDWYQRSDQRRYFVPCPHCGQEFEMSWNLVKWDKDQRGNALPETARMYCPHCGAQVRGPYKPDGDMLARGRWRPTNPNSRIRGYHINSLCSPWVDLQALVAEFVEANKARGRQGLMEFINLKLGEVWEERGADADFWERLYNRREEYPRNGTLPEGVLILTAGIDVQHDRLECSIYGWGKGRECWGIEHRIIPGAPDRPEPWAALDEILREKRSLSCGAQVEVACACVDSGDGAYSSDVYRYTSAREPLGVFSIKGRAGLGTPFINPPSQRNAVGATLFTLGVDSGKAALMARLKLEDTGPGFVHYDRNASAGFSENFFLQLTAEVLESKLNSSGQAVLGWSKIRERNEALDCAVYATAAMEILNPDFEAFDEFYKNGGAARQNQQRRRGTVSRGVTL